jgi:hypothetical protein
MPMQVRMTRFKMKPDNAGEARGLMKQLKDEILGQPGMRHCLIVMNPDGAGHVIAQIDEAGGSPEAVDRVRAIWHKFHDHLETVPDPEIFEVVADWPT